MEADFCIEAIQEAIARSGKLEIMAICTTTAASMSRRTGANSLRFSVASLRSGWIGAGHPRMASLTKLVCLGTPSESAR
jgi:hypothetical protein